MYIYTQAIYTYEYILHVYNIELMKNIIQSVTIRENKARIIASSGSVKSFERFFFSSLEPSVSI